MSIKKPSEIYNSKLNSKNSSSEEFYTVNESYDKFKYNLEKVNSLYEKVEILSQQVSQKLSRSDLENAMFSQLMVIDENFTKIKKQVNGLNKKDLGQFKESVSNLSEVVENFLKKEIPKYKKNTLETKFYVEQKLDQITNSVENDIKQISEEVDTKFNNVADAIDNNMQYFDQKIEKNIAEVKNTVKTYKNISNILEKRVSTENEKFEEYSNLIENLSIYLKELEFSFNENFDLIANNIDDLKETISINEENVSNAIGDLKETISINEENVSNAIGDLKETISINEQNIINVDNYLRKNYKQLSEKLTLLKKEVFSEINDLPIGNLQENIERLEEKINYIRETYSKIKPESIVEEVIKEGLSEPPSTNNQDPLTPLNKNYVTLDQLQEHYRLFLNRIQQQLSTVGGGGETRLKYLDDIVGIATNASFYDDKFLKYNHSLGKFEFSSVEIPIYAKNTVFVSKDGDDSNDGSFTKPKLTIKSAVESLVSSARTDNVVKILPGTYIENNPIVLPDQVTLEGESLRETTVIPQNDNEDLFYVGNGNYITDMSFRGSLNNKSIVSFDPTKPRYINQSPYVQNCTNFIPNSIGVKIDGKHAIGPFKSMVVDSFTQYNQGGIGASITNSAYAQLVSMFTICNDIAVFCGSGGACDLTNSNSSFGNYGLIADGVSEKKYVGIVTIAAAERSDTFVVDLSTPQINIADASYDNISGILTVTTSTNHNFSVGIGVTIAGLEFTCTSGPGIVTYPSGNYGYVFEVNQIISSNQFSAYVGTSTLPHTYQSGGTVSVNVVRPYDGQSIYFNDLFNEVKTLNITYGGSGYTSPPTILIDPPSTSWGVRAQAIPIIENGVLIGVDMLSNGRGYTSVPNLYISPPSSGINTATATVELEPEYYTISKSTPITSNISIITLNENVPFAVGVGTTVNFYKQSRILASGHSFEFIGSGTEIQNAIPFNGGTPPNPDNETNSRNGGLVVYTSTNQSGNFKIGDGVSINQNTGSITGKSYTKSLVSTMTPYILSLGGI